MSQAVSRNNHYRGQLCTISEGLCQEIWARLGGRERTTEAVSSDALGVGHGELKRVAICEPQGRGHQLIQKPVADMTAPGNDMDIARDWHGRSTAV